MTRMAVICLACPVLQTSYFQRERADHEGEVVAYCKRYVENEFNRRI